MTVGKGPHATVPFHRQKLIIKHVASVFRVSSDLITAPGFHDWYLSLHTILCSSLIFILYFCLCLVKPPVSSLGLDLMTCFCCLFSSSVVLLPSSLQVIRVLPVQPLGGRVLTMVTEL